MISKSSSSFNGEITSPLSAFSDLRTIELSPIFQNSFEYTVGNTQLNTNITTNSGTVTQAEAMAVVGTGTTTNSTACLQSKQHAKYRSGFGGLDRFTALFSSPVADTEQLFGIVDEEGSSVAFKNGFAIGYIGTVFGLHIFQNDSITTVQVSVWDDPLDGSGPSGMDITQTNLGIFGINFEYLGGGPVLVYVQNEKTGKSFIAHTHVYANKNTTPIIHNPNLRHQMFVSNKTTTSDVVVKSGSYGYFTEGLTSHIEIHQLPIGTGEKEKTGVTTEVAIVTIRNKATYQSKTNFIDIILHKVFASIEASSTNNLGKVRVVRNATLGGTPSFSDINTSDSVVEFDVAGTTVTGGVEYFPLPLAGKNDSKLVQVENDRIIVYPGDTITLAGSSANSATIRSGAFWVELF